VTCRSAIARLRAKSYTSKSDYTQPSLALEYKILAFILLPLSVTEERLDNRAHHTAINRRAAPLVADDGLATNATSAASSGVANRLMSEDESERILYPSSANSNQV